MPNGHDRIPETTVMKMLKLQFAYRVKHEGLLKEMMFSKTFKDCDIILPERIVETVLLEMSEKEKKYYLTLENIIRDKASKMTVRGNYVQMLGYIIGLRQAANDLRLITKVKPFFQKKARPKKRHQKKKKLEQ